MAFDAYAPCPCGSSKKFKFCCIAAAEEIEKVAQLQENHQVQATHQVLDRLEKTKPNLAWTYVTRAGLLMSEGRSVEAREVLDKLMAQHPDHPFGLALHALGMLTTTGYDEAKPAIYKAFRQATHDYPDVVGSLALGISAIMERGSAFLSCRQYLAHAMRLVPEQDKQSVFLRLLEFDGNELIPYPLRSVHPIQPYSVGGEGDSAERTKLLKRAERSVALGCYETAANLYERLADDDPESVVLWANAGLCWAWDGDETEAAEALHRAAQLEPDFDTAVEYETLAQLLDQGDPDSVVAVSAVGYRVASVGRLLTLLDEQPQCSRRQVMDEEDAESEMVEILDRPLAELPEDATESDVPQILGRLMLTDPEQNADDKSPMVWLTSIGEEAFTAARRFFEEQFASEIEESFEQPEDRLLSNVPAEFLPLRFVWRVPEGTSGVRRQALEQQRWQRNVDEVWPNLSLSALGGKTPTEAAGDEELKLPLAAAVFVFDAFCEANRYALDVPAMSARMQVPPPAPLPVTGDLPLASLSVMKLHRLPVAELNDDQLLYVLNRALLLRYNPFLSTVLQEALSRPGCQEKVDLFRAYSTLAELAERRRDRTEALDWIRKAQAEAEKGEEGFANVVRAEFLELQVRAMDPSDPELRPLASRMLGKYSKKLPQLAEQIRVVLASFGVTVPEAVQVAGVSGEVSSGGIWTPGAEPAASSNKLWLPGSGN